MTTGDGGKGCLAGPRVARHYAGRVAIDLHTHSTASDGTEAPSVVVERAVEAGLTTVALTDHDTTLGWAQASDAARAHGIRLGPGIEVSCSRWGKSILLLAYLPVPGEVGLDLGRIAAVGPAHATWIDPRNGDKSPAGEFPAAGTRRFKTPTGWQDALLVVEAGARGSSSR